MSITEGDKFSDDNEFHLTQIINNINTGIWEYNISTKDVKWSPGFYALLGYEPGEITPSYDYFFENLLYYEDKPLFTRSINRHFHETPETIRIRLLTKQSGFRWFSSTAKRWDDNSVPKITGSIADIHDHRLLELQSTRNDFLFKETVKIAKIGGWEIDVKSMALTFNRETYDIYELQDTVKLSIEEAISFFEPDYRQLMAKAVDNIIKYSQPFDLELMFRTARNNQIWLRAKGLAVIDDYGKCVTVRAIFQNIDYIKKKELEVQEAVDLLSDQNKRLQNFAYIVSHNLRSHTGNLQFMVNLFDQTDVEDDRTEIFTHIKAISGSLNTTIEHLSEIVKIQTEIAKDRKKLSFEPTLKTILSALESNIKSTGAKIEYDFSECPEVFYIPAYLESIFQNLVTNSIKYRHPDRKPVIKIRSAKIRHHIYLYFEDNGIGIADRHFDRIFQMFIQVNEPALYGGTGVGLAIVKKAVQTMQGTVGVESVEGQGSKFWVDLIKAT